jgi:SNF2 family DNA or RNA helicase
MDGLASNSTTEQVAQQVRTSKKLFDATAPFVQRRGISFLTRDLPPCQTVVIYIRPSKLQSSLYRSFDKFARQLFGENKLSFIAHYQMLRPLHNHPYCLVQQARGKGDNRKGDEQGQKRLGNNGPLKVKAELCQDSKNVSYEKRIDDDGVIFLLDSDSDEGVPGSGRNSPVEDAVKDQATSVKELNAEAKPAAVSKRSLSKGRKQMEYPWMEKILAKIDESKLDSVKHGFKIFLLLQILAHAQSMGDKVVVFSQCLKTLDFIEKVLNTNDWARFCQGQEQNKKLGSWKKGVDYLRIDGSVNATERGQLVSDFHEELGGIKAFLLSIEAGGIG